MKIIVVFLAALILVSAAPSDRKKDKGGKGGKGGKPEQPDRGERPGFQTIVRFCEGVTEGELTNNDTNLDSAFYNVNDTCTVLLDFLRDCDEGDDYYIPDNKVSLKKFPHITESLIFVFSEFRYFFYLKFQMHLCTCVCWNKK